MATCIKPDIRASSAYRYYNCRCERCRAWKSDAAKRTNDMERAKERSRLWRINNIERSRQNSKTYQRNSPRKLLEFQIRKYGLTLEEYDKLGTKCSICGTDKSTYKGHRRLCVDHDSVTGKVRGILCISCNLGIGHLKHDKQLLTNAIEYLEKNT